MRSSSRPSPDDPACDQVREAVSARLDGEDPGPTGLAVDQHLSDCRSCRQWASSVQRLHGMARVTEAPAVPDLQDRIMTAVTAGRAGSTDRHRTVDRRREARMVLGLAGLVQVVVALVGLVGADALHAVREVAAFELSLGVALVVAAWRPGRFAVGMVPLVVVAAVVVLGAAVVDVATGLAGPLGEFSHLVPAIGAGVLWWLADTAGLRGRGASA